MEYKSVESSTIRTIGYDAEQELLEITFNSGATYRYTGVPATIANTLLNAESKGSYFSVNIRSNYPCERIHLETCGKYLECTAPNCACWCHKVRKDVTNGRTQENEARTGSLPQGKAKAPSKAKAKKRQPI
jgi:hypothetical protein